MRVELDRAGGANAMAGLTLSFGRSFRTYRYSRILHLVLNMLGVSDASVDAARGHGE